VSLTISKCGLCERRANGRYTHTLNLTPLLPYLKSNIATQKKPYQASDIPSSLSRNPIEEEGEKAGLLSFLVKGLLLALEIHPIMRSRVKFSGDEKWLEVGRDGIVGVAVSGMSSQPQSPPTSIIEVTCVVYLYGMKAI